MKTLGLLFTRNVSLKIWVDSGLLEREKMIYEEQLKQGTYDEIYWFTYGTGDDKLAEKLIREGKLDGRIKVIPMLALWKGRIGYDLYSLLMPVIKRKDFKRLDIIKSNQMDGAWTGLIAKRLFHIPFYFRTGYTNTMFYRKMTQRKDFNLWKFSKIEKMLYNKCDLATVSSEHDRQYLCETYGIQKEKISVLVNHVNTEKFYDMKKPQRKERLVFVGRLVEQKNLFHTIEAVAQAKAGMDIYGQGKLQEQLFEVIKTLDADVKFMGTVPNDQIPSILNDYKYYILASEYEGMPKTLLEAMACGNLCIGTKVEGIEEVIADGVNGYLAEDTSVTAIREAIERAENDRQFEEKKEAAQKYIREKYSIQSVLDKEKELCSQFWEGKN